MSEVLPDAANYIDDEGEVKPLDEMATPVVESHFDHVENAPAQPALFELLPPQKTMAERALDDAEDKLDAEVDAAVAIEVQAEIDATPQAEPEFEIETSEERTPLKEERANRLVRAQVLNGFYPQEKAELVQVTALSSETYAVGGAAKLLSETMKFRLKHAPDSDQDEADPNGAVFLFDEDFLSDEESDAEKADTDKKAYDPAAALRKIVRDWGGYIKDSRGDLTALLLLKDQIGSADIEPFTALTNVSGVRDWTMQDITQRAIGAITRQYELRQFAEQGGQEYMGTQYSTRNREVISREASVVKNLRVREARQVVDSLINAHRARIDYWKARLEEATANKAVDVVAREVLEKL